MAIAKHRKDQHSISLSIRRADLHCLLRAQLQPQPPLALVPPARPSIHLQKRRRKRLSPWFPLVVSGKHLPLGFHLVKNHLRVQRRLRPLPSNLHSRLQVLLLYHHSRLVLHLLLRIPLANLRQLLRHLVPRLLIDPHRSPSEHPPRRSQQPVRSHLDQAVNLLPLLLAILPFRLERPEVLHLHSVPGQMRLPHLPLGLAHQPLRRRRREDHCSRWGLHHHPRKVAGE